LPDSVFIEDTAVVLPELAIVTRPGAPSRRAETEAVRTKLQAYRKVAAIEPPGTLDGGDVLTVGRTLFIGRTPRTSAEGIEQTRRLVSAMGYSVVAVSVEGCLHLKSAVTAVSDEVLLVQPLWVNRSAFSGLTLLEVDPRELYAANALRIGDRVIYPSAFPRTAERIAARGIDIHAVDASELPKAESAVTCCSLVFCERTGS
jgi:dimethylargininase